MGREIKRVPLDFDWPMKKVWAGYMLVFHETVTEEDVAHFAKLIKCKYGDASDITFFAPPTGDGWQMWENTSEGSPISPVFKTPEELARWLVDNNASAFGEMTATYEEWLATINAGYSVGMVVTVVDGEMTSLQTGVAANISTTKVLARDSNEIGTKN